MAKNIVVCCDGTGNEFVADNNSNVVKLYSTVIINAGQRAYYHPGVGTMGAPTARGPVEKQWTRLVGLGLGGGLLDQVGWAYQFLMNTYEEGDRIYLFGFSRGAYTVRAVASMLHMYGLLCPGNEGLIPYITRMFAQRTRRHGGMKQTFEVAHEFKHTFSRDCLIHFVGVWDTVSSVGWIYNPLVLPYSARNPIMITGRHAVSIDERRCFFLSNLWGSPYERSEREYRVDQDIKQVWFAGVHSDVGGSYSEQESGLSKITLEWMLTEAVAAELDVDPVRAAIVLGKTSDTTYARPDPTAQLHNSLQGAWRLLEFVPHRYYDRVTGTRRWRIPMGARRQIPEDSLIHQTVLDRMNAIPDYRPSLPDKRHIEPWMKFPAAAAAGK